MGNLYCCDVCGKSCNTPCETCRRIYCCVECHKQPKWLEAHGKICAKTLAQRFRNICNSSDIDFTTKKYFPRQFIQGKVFYRPGEIWVSWAKSPPHVPFSVQENILRQVFDVCNATCIGCGVSRADLDFRQTLVLKDDKQIDLYYCERCAKGDRFVHPKSLMTLRETWIVLAACWVYAAKMPKVLLPLMQEHFRVCWKQDIIVEDLSEDMFVPDCCGIDDYEYEYVDDDSGEANAMFPIHQVDDIEVPLEN